MQGVRARLWRCRKLELDIERRSSAAERPPCQRQWHGRTIWPAAWRSPRVARLLTALHEPFSSAQGWVGALVHARRLCSPPEASLAALSLATTLSTEQSAMLGWLGRQRSGGGAGADKPTARAPALGGLLVALGLRGREPTLPVRTKRPHGSSPGTPAGGKKQQQQQQGRGGLQQRCVFLLAFLFFAAAVATATAAAAVSLYVHSILHEPPAVLAAATAEVHAAVAAAAAARAAAGFAPAAAPAPPAALLADPLQPPDPAEPEALGDEEQEQDRQRAQALFTGVEALLCMIACRRIAVLACVDVGPDGLTLAMCV